MTDLAPDIDRDVRKAWNDTAPHEQWLVEVNAADGYVIATNEKDRSFLRVPVLVGEAIEFGEPVRVVPGYVGAPVAASRVVFASRAESRPEVAAAEAAVLDAPPPLEQAPPNPILPVEAPAPPDPTDEPRTPPPPGGVPVSGEPAGPPDVPGAEPESTETKEDLVSTTMSGLRSRLGLTDDADEAAVLAAVDALKAKADAPPEPNPEQVAASAAKAKENDDLRAKVAEQQKEVTVLASQVKTMSDELAAEKAAKAATVKASILDEAQKQGKFAPAAREQWDKDYDEAPAAVTRILASIAPGTAVPVVAAGYTGTGEEVADSTFDRDYEAFFRTEKAGA
jgi:hypothetical protein